MDEIDYSKTQATVAYLLNGDRVLLVEKGRNIGKGKLVGVGGRQEEGETLDETAVREIAEEIQVTARSIRKVGVINFIFPHNPKYSQLVSAYIVDDWEGEPQVTEEAKTVDWYDISDLPIGRMWHDNSIWLPVIFQGKLVRGEFTIGTDNRVVEFKLEEVDSFDS